MLKKFWNWYERHETLSLGLAAGLFLLQIFHLYWLTADVVFFRIFGNGFFNLPAWFETLLIFIDYLEIPTLIAVSLVYINQLRKSWHPKSFLYLILLNSQWLHIFWITDEYVIEKLTGVGAGTILPVWLAGIAIFIDYLELPVIFDTIKRFAQSLKKDGWRASLAKLNEK